MMVKTEKQRSDKQLLNDLKLKEKFKNYHKTIKESKELNTSKDILNLIDNMNTTDLEIQNLLKTDKKEDMQLVIKRRGRPKLKIEENK